VILKRLLEKILKLHNCIAEINKKLDLESGKNINVKGAKEALKSKQEALRETDKQLGILRDKLEETHQQYNEMCLDE